ncbi:MAG: hypothetical protein A3C35_03640 [Omnitrophica bacterium RIFCSPHIGHO2_02_FULL_46_11]|nr:MAG: hypothetical protein A3A81_05865 [Omnitrophica bacterium RIFCSPLOWO2_01_FULL_45_10b]OGW87437.1 MAG: hypothetical protein A3C35_03640 [Omnitrophica bacterium RIFCSPHIGHO2_02_FULL_46_11]
MRGGEKTLEAIADLFPEAPIYTLFLEHRKLSPELQKREIHVSFLQYIPSISKFYRWLLPLFPIAVRFLNVQKFDLVISSSHCVAKAVRVREDAVHICYCHTPMRYLWGFSEDYFGQFPKFLRWLTGFYFQRLKKWDIKTSQKVTSFIANSRNTATKIKTFYGKTASVICPPVELPDEKISFVSTNQGKYFLIVSALVPYKRIELAIEAFNQLKQPLRIVGEGPLRSKLERITQFEGIQFEGWLDQAKLRERYADCRALIFPGEEDFGIVPLEAQAYGKPVIAYGKGGALESVTSDTGIFFYEQSAEALIKAVKKFEHFRFDSQLIKHHAQSFNSERFKREILELIKQLSMPLTV